MKTKLEKNISHLYKWPQFRVLTIIRAGRIRIVDVFLRSALMVYVLHSVARKLENTDTLVLTRINGDDNSEPEYRGGVVAADGCGSGGFHECHNAAAQGGPSTRILT